MEFVARISRCNNPHPRRTLMSQKKVPLRRTDVQTQPGKPVDRAPAKLTPVGKPLDDEMLRHVGGGARTPVTRW